VFDAVIIGLVEGLTEFLPVSSTGHLLIVQALLGSHQSDAFNVLIQVGPIVAATLVFWPDVVRLLTGWRDPENRDEAIKLGTSFVLTGAGGLLAKKMGLELPETVLPIALATLIGALAIFWIERRVKGRELSSRFTWAVAFAIAAGQLLAAVFPGTSRSGAAVMAALLVGLTRPAAVRSAFLVGIPTMFAAGGYQLFKAVQDGQGASLFAPEALMAFVVATVTAWLSVVWLLRFVQTRNFIPFAWYRVVLGLVLLALVGVGWVR